MKFPRWRLLFAFGLKFGSNTGKSIGINYTLAPLAVLVIVSAVASLPARAAEGSSLAISRSSVAFGSVAVGSTSEQSITVTNHGPSSITILSVVVAGANFRQTGLASSLTIAAGRTAAVLLHFTPSTVGNFRGTLTIESNATNRLLTIVSTGLGIEQLNIDSAATYFIGVAIGSKEQHTITLTNNGQTPVRISKVIVSGAGFSQLGLEANVTIPPLQKKTFTEYFAPRVATEVKGAIAIYSNASDPLLTIASIGVGMQQISISPAVAFGEVTVGNKGQRAITITNHGNTSVRVSKITVSGADFIQTGLVAPVIIAAQKSLTFTAYFVPKAAGETEGAITVASNGSDPSVTVVMTGIGTASTGHLVAVPVNAEFQKVAIGETNSQSIRVSNTSAKSVVVSRVDVAGTGFTLVGLAASFTIPAGGSSTFNVKFSPALAGTTTGSVSLVSNAANSPLTIPLVGTSIPATLLLQASSASLNFEKVAMGNSSLLNVTLTNEGNSKVTISTVRLTGAGFSESGAVSGLVLAPAQSTTVKIVFKPTVVGSIAGSLSVASNATNSPTTVSMEGAGVAESSHLVKLAWDASSSPEIVGYHVYRGTVSGGPYARLTSSVIDVTQYVDSSVAAGETYYYVVTSVDSVGLESAHSNQASARVPSS
jgi:ASPM-SPD-2-Hydin domain-containing protein/centrosomal CEP192-like protein